MKPHFLLLAAVTALPALTTLAADYPAIKTKAYSTPQLLFALRTDTQTVARLTPVADPSHDFTPGPREEERQFDGYRHLGDLSLKLRVGDGDWQSWTSYAQRKPVRVLPAVRVLAAADLAPTMGAGLPLTVERRWLNDKGILVLRYTLINRSKQAVEVAEAGMPMVFDFGSNRVKPHPGDRGYADVARLEGPPLALRVTPDGKTPLNSWQPPAEQRAAGEDYASWVTGGFTLKPGGRRDIGLRFTVRPNGATR
jgi:hypothetical protein